MTVARHDHLVLTYEAGHEVARAGDFALVREHAPRPSEDPLKLEPMYLRIGQHAERDLPTLDIDEIGEAGAVCEDEFFG